MHLRKTTRASMAGRSSSRGKTAARFAAALCIASAVVNADDRAQNVATAPTVLPDAPEKTLVMQYCAICHDIARVQHAGGTETGWAERIHRMIRWGATIPTEQIQDVAAYLAKALPPRPLAISTAATDFKFTVSSASVRSLQTWVRTAGRMDSSGRQLVACVDAADAESIKVGQRARVFAVASRSSMQQAKVMHVTPRAACHEVDLTLASQGYAASAEYVIEIAATRGDFLSIPNEAIIEEGDKQRVYVKEQTKYAPREIQTGLQGELYTQVVGGLKAGDEVVTLGNFFIDAEYKMNGSAE